MNMKHMQESARQASTLLKSLGNENRLLILCNLVNGEKSVGELQTLIGLKQSALSQHLARLRRDNLVTTRRQAQTIYYSLHGEQAKRVIGVLYDMYCASPRSNRKEPQARPEEEIV